MYGVHYACVCTTVVIIFTEKTRKYAVVSADHLTPLHAILTRSQSLTCRTQVQYDFGVRSVVRLLRVLASTKRSSAAESEQVLVVQALRDLNVGQLADRDEPLFLSLVNDLFPGIVLDTTRHPGLEAALTRQLDAAGLVNHPPWTFKLMQVIFTVNDNSSSSSKSYITRLPKVIWEQAVLRRRLPIGFTWAPHICH